MPKNEFGRKWIISNSIDITEGYPDGMLTLRALHYQLVGIGMPNTLAQYKAVVAAVIKARWEGLIEFSKFSDHDRAMIGKTKSEIVDLNDAIQEGKTQVRLWMTNYRKNRWENQPYYPEIFIEKKALQGVFQDTCKKFDVALGACKGYPSLTFLNDAADRFKEAESQGFTPIILYFGDYDPTGEDIPRSIEANLSRLGVDVRVKRVLLMEEQVLAWNLPHAPVKQSDSRTAKWDGFGQVELDAVSPDRIQEFCENAIMEIFDEDKYEELMEEQELDKEKYRAELKTYVNDL